MNPADRGQQITGRGGGGKGGGLGALPLCGWVGVLVGGWVCACVRVCGCVREPAKVS